MNFSIGFNPIPGIKAKGFEVKKMGGGRYRIGGRIDYWPKENRWHDIKTMERGDVAPENLEEFLRARLCTA